MGGGQQGISTDPNGLAFPTTTGGFDWTKLGGVVSKGLQSFGSAYGQGQQDSHNYMTGTPSLYQSPGDYQSGSGVVQHDSADAK